DDALRPRREVRRPRFERRAAGLTPAVRGGVPGQERREGHRAEAGAAVGEEVPAGPGEEGVEVGWSHWPDRPGGATVVSQGRKPLECGQVLSEPRRGDRRRRV